MRRGSASIAANPVLIGAATVLVVVVAVFLAYNANNGLPFVPTYQLKAELPNASSLVVGNEVRVGGTRVGAVDEIKAVADRNGRARALITMQLERSIKPLPVDTTVLVRNRSILGLKYVQLTKGNSSKGLPDGATIPIRQARPQPVEFDQFLSTFDDPTRKAQEVNIREFGDGLAGRGADLNRFIESAAPLLRDALPVLRNLSDPDTQLERLFRALGRTATLLAPVAEEQAQVFVNLNRTVKAFADTARPFLQESIEEAPEALRVPTEEFPKQRPFLRDSERLFAELRPGARELKTAAKPLADAIDAGATTLARSVAFNQRADDSVRRHRHAHPGPAGLGRPRRPDDDRGARLPDGRRADARADGLQLRDALLPQRLEPAQRRRANGTWQRFIIFNAPEGPNNEQFPSSAPANGGGGPGNYLHSNQLPNTASPANKVHECEAGNEGWVSGRQVIGNVPGNQGLKTERTTRDAGVGP